jgi:hypothetical protein
MSQIFSGKKLAVLIVQIICSLICIAIALLLFIYFPRGSNRVVWAGLDLGFGVGIGISLWFFLESSFRETLNLEDYI